jgi:hypothetical protein
MNSQTYRLVFNKSRGCLIAVGEHACSSAGGGGACARRSKRQSINAGKTYTQTGSDVLTPAGDIAITAQKVDINEARETGSQSSEQKFKQSGLTVAITSPVLSAVQTANNQLQAAKNTSSDRMQALAAANAVSCPSVRNTLGIEFQPRFFKLPPLGACF